MNSEGTSHILCKRDKKYYVSVWDQIKLQKTGVTISFWLVQFSLFTLFSYREKICCFGLQYFVCRFIYLFNSYLFVFFFYFITNLLFFAFGNLILLCPRWNSGGESHCLDSGLRCSTFLTQNFFKHGWFSLLRYKTELDSASASSYENLKMLFMLTFGVFFVGLCTVTITMYML